MMAEPVDYAWQSDLKVLFDAIVKMYDEYPKEDERALLKEIVDMKSAMRAAYTTDIADKSAKPDFSENLGPWTYIYSYLLRHVHLVYAALMKVHELEHTESLNKLKDGPIVCCVGGGPNSDALGLQIFLRAKRWNLPKEVCVLDEYDKWRETWEEMKLSVGDQSLMPETEWEKCDLLEDISPKNETKIRKADIITMIKTLSALAAPDETLRTICDGIMKMMKPKALLLFIDNKAERACDLLIEASRKFNGSSHNVLYDEEDKGVTLSPERQNIFSDDAEELISKIKDQPVLKSGENRMILIYRFE